MDNTCNRHQHDASDSKCVRLFQNFFEAQCLTPQYVQGQILKYYYLKSPNVYG